MQKLQFNYEPVNKEKLIEDLMESPLLNNFFIDNDLTSDFIEDNLLDFISYKTEKNHCLDCQGLHECKQDNEGFEPVISFQEGVLLRKYKKCNFLKNLLNKAQTDSHIDAMHLPSRILEASLEDWRPDLGKNRMKVYKTIKNFINLYQRGDKPKGFYLWGENGIGKTYAISALAKELIKLNVSVVMAYYPDLVREFKSRVANNSLEELISKLKQVEVLMLDDIGGEGESYWVRDEVLGPILQYRLLDNKPTIFTSNYSRVQLHDLHFSQFKDFSKTKSTRIVTRIADLTKSETEDFQIEM